MIFNAGSLAGTTAVTAGLGYVYWWVAARQYSASAVGLAGAAVSAMTLLATIGVMGLGTMLIGELHRRHGGEARLIVGAASIAGLTSAVLGVCFALICSRLSVEFEPLATGPVQVALFATGVGLTAAAQVFDSAVVGLLRGGLQFVRNLVFSTGKLGVLVVASVALPNDDGLTIYAAWLLGNLASVAVVVAMLAFSAGPGQKHQPTALNIRGLGRTAVAHHVLNVALHFSPLVVPVLVTAMLSATTNAYFYVAWMVAGVLYLGPVTLTTVLYAVGVRDPSTLASKTRFTVGLSLIGALAANACLFLAGDAVLGLFGDAYPANSGPTLRILALGVIPSIVKEHYVAIARIHERTRSAAVLVTVGAVLELAFVAAGAYVGGLEGLSAGWVAALTVEALLMATSVYRVMTIRGEPMAEDSRPGTECLTGSEHDRAEDRSGLGRAGISVQEGA